MLIRPAAEIPPLLQIRDLHVSYPQAPIPVLSAVNLDIHAGEVVSLLGASGAGKSTLFKAITGFVPMGSGSIRVNGTEVSQLRGRGLRELRSTIGQVSQHHGLVGKLPALTNVLVGGLHNAGPWSLMGVFRSSDKKRAVELLELLGVADKAGVPARELSGGQQQRVAIARMLMQKPRLILADEPVAALDPALSAQMLHLFRSIAQEESIPILLSLHQPHFALRYSERILGLVAGGITIDAPASQLSPADLTQFYERQGLE